MINPGRTGGRTGVFLSKPCPGRPARSEPPKAVSDEAQFEAALGGLCYRRDRTSPGYRACRVLALNEAIDPSQGGSWLCGQVFFMGDDPHDPTIARYVFLAEWYRGWAKIAGNDTTRQQRIAIAELMECLVQEMSNRQPEARNSADDQDS